MSTASHDDERLDDEYLITVERAAELLHISRSGVYRLIRHGDLRCLHIGHNVRLRASDVQAFIHNAKWGMPRKRRAKPRSG